jgi:ketopantoate reductase
VHVAIVGAGALGLAYGVWSAGFCEVSFVVRRNAPRGGVRVERVGRTKELAREVRRVAAVRASTEVAAEADVIVVTVRADQLASALGRIADGTSDAPVVVLTPMMPVAYAEARALLGNRLRAAMPGVIAYLASAVDDTEDDASDVRVRAWFPAAAPTFIDELRGTADQQTTLAALAETWTAAGLATRFAMGVHETNPATTAAFVPLAMAVDVAGSLDALVADAALLDLAVRAADEGLALGARLGPVAPWAALLTRFARPSLIKLGVALARRSAAEASGYVDGHFGRKLHAQNVAMAAELVELAKERGEAHAALEELRLRLASVSS